MAADREEDVQLPADDMKLGRPEGLLEPALRAEGKDTVLLHAFRKQVFDAGRFPRVQADVVQVVIG